MMIQRTYCPGCGTHRFKEAERLCDACADAHWAGARIGQSLSPSQRPALDAWLDEHGKEAASVAAPVPATDGIRQTNSQPITFGGHQLDAPGFDLDSFERAVLRAFVDELQLRHDQTGQALVCHAGVNGGYRTTRHTCNCPAGQVGTPCKHRAFWIFVHDVREPARRREWQQAERAAMRKVAA